jgi:hypothetical protein
MTTGNPPMMRAEELAQRWDTSTGRLANMRSAGTGPKFVRIGTSIRYRLSDIDAYETANTVEPISA